MFGICLSETLQPEVNKPEARVCEVEDVADNYTPVQANGDWIARYLTWMRDLTRQLTPKTGFDWRFNRYQISHNILKQIPDENVRNRLIHFTNDWYEKWKKAHVVIPNEALVATRAREQTCTDCSLRVMTDHTGRTVPLCNVDCSLLQQARNDIAPSLYACNADVLHRLYAEFCKRCGYTNQLPYPSSEFVQLPTDPPYDSTLQPLVSFRQLLKDAREKSA